MSKQITTTNAIEHALVMNDLSKLSTDERLSYYNKVCESLGLNPLTQPFAYISLNGKLTLYAKRDATEQLRKVHKVSINITARETIEGVYVVTAKARDADGREDESTGAVAIKGLQGDALANAFLKAETKAKRRVTLSICGLGLLDETEVETIPQAAKKEVNIEIKPLGVNNENKAKENPKELKPVIERASRENSGESGKPVEGVKAVEPSSPDSKTKDNTEIHPIEQAELYNLAQRKSISPSKLQDMVAKKYDGVMVTHLRRWQFEEIKIGLSK